MNLAGLPYALMSMGLEDVPTVAATDRAVFTISWSASAFRYEISQNPTSEYLVLRYLPWSRDPPESSILSPVRRFLGGEAEDDQSLLGYGGFWLLVDEAHICALALRAEWRGYGLGELLFAGLIERAIARCAHSATLEVRASNAVAQNLYRKHGLKVAGRRKRYYVDNREDALIMTADAISSAAYRERFLELQERLYGRLAALPDPPLGTSRRPR